MICVYTEYCRYYIYPSELNYILLIIHCRGAAQCPQSYQTLRADSARLGLLVALINPNLRIGWNFYAFLREAWRTEKSLILMTSLSLLSGMRQYVSPSWSKNSDQKILLLLNYSLMQLIESARHLLRTFLVIFNIKLILPFTGFLQ